MQGWNDGEGIRLGLCFDSSLIGRVEEGSVPLMAICHAPFACELSLTEACRQWRKAWTRVPGIDGGIPIAAQFNEIYRPSPEPSDSDAVIRPTSASPCQPRGYSPGGTRRGSKSLHLAQWEMPYYPVWLER